MAQDIDWDLYRTFLAVLTEGSLSGAARALGLSQPTVGRHVDALEAQVGQRLFTRSQSGLIPSETALALRPHAEALESSARALRRAVSESRGSLAGTVRITASEVVGVELLPHLLATVCEAHPEIEVEISLSDSMADLLHRDADIAIRMAEPTQAALVVQKTGALALGLHAHRSYLEARGIPSRATDLADHRLIGFDRRTAYIRTMEARHPEVAELHFGIRADSTLAQLAAIRAGLGIGFCQTGIARRDGDLVRVLPETFAATMETWIAMHESLRSIPRYRLVFRALADALREHVETWG